MRICVLSRGVPDEMSPLNGMYEWGHAVLLHKLGYGVTVVAVDLRVGKKRKGRGLSVYEKDGIKVDDDGVPVGAVKRSVARNIRLSVFKKIFSELHGNGETPDFNWIFFGRSFGKIAEKIKETYGVPYAVSEYESRLLTERIKKRDAIKLRGVYGRAAFRVAPNPAFGNRLSALFGCDFSVLTQYVTGKTLKRRHDGYVFLSIGALAVEKGMDVLLRAFSYVKRGNGNVFLTIVGRGDEKKRLEELSRSLGVEKSVNFVTETDNLRDFFAKSDCFVLASRKELFGAIYLEAMAEGLPVLTTDCFAPGGLIPRKCGRVVPVDDAASLAVCMAEACAGETYHTEEIKAFAEENFSVEALGVKIERLFVDYYEKTVKTDIK